MGWLLAVSGGLLFFVVTEGKTQEQTLRLLFFWLSCVGFLVAMYSMWAWAIMQNPLEWCEEKLDRILSGKKDA